MKKINSGNSQKITPFLWFNDQAEDAAKFYVSLFKNSRIVNIARYGEAGPGPKGSVLMVDFEIESQRFTALNGGPRFVFTEAVSFVIHCDTQQEVDEFWERLAEGGKKSMCGWVKDKFGLWWQVVPVVLYELFQSEDTQKSNRVMEAMLKMDKFDIKTLQQAYQGN